MTAHAAKLPKQGTAARRDPGGFGDGSPAAPGNQTAYAAGQSRFEGVAVKRSKVNAATAVVGLAVLALVAGCSSSSKTSSSATSPPKPAAAPATTTTTEAPGHSAELQVITGTATGTSPCELAAPTPASPGEVGAGTGGSEANASKVSVVVSEHGARGMVKQQNLTPAQQKDLDVQMSEANAAAAKYPTVATALAAGYSDSTTYVPCIGAHYTNQSYAGSFDPSHPSELLYDGTDPNSKLVGLSYLVWHPGGPPPGFAGANDHWHQHNANGGLCLKGGYVVGGEADTPAQCAAAGGHKALLLDIWMLHAWVVPGYECYWGVFSGECPQLGGRLGGNAFDTPAPSPESSKAAASG